MSDYTQEELQTALTNAHAAGDMDAVSSISKLMGVNPQQQPQPEVSTNPWVAAGKQAIESAPVALGSMALGTPMASAGAALGAPFGPPGMALGGIAGGLLGSYLGGKATENIMEPVQFPEPIKQATGFDKTTREIERQQNPNATTLGELAPNIATMAVPASSLEKGVMKFAADKWWNNASPIQKQAWATADEWGLKLKPSQIREDSRATIVGNPNNQRIINQKAAEATGVSDKVSHVDEKFINSRFDSLGKEYDRIYSSPSLGEKIPLVREAQDSITNLFANQIPMPTVAKNRIVQALDSVTQNGFMPGDDFRFIMSELKRQQRTTSDGNVKYALGDAIDSLNKSIETTNPALAVAIGPLNTQYRATITLDKALGKGVIDKNGNLDAHDLGKMLLDDRNNPLYSVGSVGQALGIGSINKAQRFKNVTDDKAYSYIPGVSWLANMARKAATGVYDTPVATNMMRKAEAVNTNPPAPNNLLDAFRQAATYRSGPTINALFGAYDKNK